MSKNYENKADHNQGFLDCLINDYENSYFDWKVTIQFYIALHRCYCVLTSKGINISESHNKNIQNIAKIDSTISRGLHTLFKHSKQSRYDGFIQEDSMERINKINFNKNKPLLKTIIELVPNYYPPVAV